MEQNGPCHILLTMIGRALRERYKATSTDITVNPSSIQ